MNKKIGIILLIVLLLSASWIITINIMNQFGGRTIMSCESITIYNSTGIFETHLGCVGGTNYMKVNETVALVLYEDFNNCAVGERIAICPMGHKEIINDSQTIKSAHSEVEE